MHTSRPSFASHLAASGTILWLAGTGFAKQYLLGCLQKKRAELRHKIGTKGAICKLELLLWLPLLGNTDKTRFCLGPVCGSALLVACYGGSSSKSEAYFVRV